MTPFANKLVADIGDLRAKIATVQLEPEVIANGAVELLNEVSTSKITGEEDAFSHTDLSDFAANLAGAKAAFESVKPLLANERFVSGHADHGALHGGAARARYASIERSDRQRLCVVQHAHTSADSRPFRCARHAGRANVEGRRAATVISGG